MYENIYNYRLKEALKLALKVNPYLKDQDNLYDIKDFRFYDVNIFNVNGEVFACTSKDQFGYKYIFINQKYQKDDLEPLSCLISHELNHVLDKPTLEEEIKATIAEVETWKVLKHENIKPSELTDRLDKLLHIYQEGKIKEYIESQNIYKNI